MANGSSSTGGVRIAELALALFILGYVALAWIVEHRGVPDVEIVWTLLLWAAVFVAPLGLGLTMVLGTDLRERDWGSVFFAGIGALTLLIASGCTVIYLFNTVVSTHRGGLVLFPYVSFGVGLVAAVLVVARQAVWQLPTP
ncbi:hypothetical protein [Salinarchaeum laminariae]|uniref:hypothetical protein n=1 Tax=Salinarchaeum laminariae TaxID=869888 RepID=UPI0020BE895E|nr:hypothetical protein [Salinarchaeum laminariae]